MGLVRCEKGALDWSNAAQSFLYPKNEAGEEEALEENGSKFFIGQFHRTVCIIFN